jgi:hypothetical protein
MKVTTVQMRQALMGVRVFGLFVLLAGCNPCADEIVSESVSESGRYIAALVIRDCGATTDYASHIRLRTVREPIDLNGETVAVFEGKIDSPIWLGDRLIVRFGGARRFKTYDRWSDVAITYEGR